MQGKKPYIALDDAKGLPTERCFGDKRAWPERGIDKGSPNFLNNRPVYYLSDFRGWTMPICPISGVSERNSALLLVTVEGIMSHVWCQRKEKCPIVGVSGKNCVPFFMSVGGIVPNCWCQ